MNMAVSVPVSGNQFGIVLNRLYWLDIQAKRIAGTAGWRNVFATCDAL
jgi:hypothetical protein